MNELTLFLAIIIIVAHCVAIFWPRKPFQGPTDKNGLPVLWCNQNEQSKNVACVWWGEAEDATTPEVTAKQVSTTSLTSFSKTVNPLGAAIPENRRSVA